MTEQSAITGYQEEGPPQYQADGGTDAPPSYNSIFGELKAAKAESGDDKVSFVKKVIGILMGSIVFTVVLVLLLAVPITMIAIGAIKLDDCPVEKFIPKWLLISGCFGLLKNLLSLVQQLYNKMKDQKDKNASKNPLEGILDLFLFAWFIAGSVWVFRTYGDVSYKESSEHYCDRLVFLFSFWTLMVTYICMAIGCCCCCCICIVAVPLGLVRAADS